MRLLSLRVRNYRTIGQVEQTLSFGGGLTIVGPNNSGKTNLLSAVQLLFTGRDNSHSYSRERDLPFGHKRVKTSLLATFEGDPTADSDRHLYDLLDQLHSILGTQRSSSTFNLSLVFTEGGNPVYQFFPNAKQPSVTAARVQFSRTQTQLVAELLEHFSCHYVPSARSVGQLYEELLIPFLRTATAKALAPHEPVISSALSTIADSFNAELSAAGLGNLSVSFDLPDKSLEQLIRGFDYMISDPDRTPVSHKGQGVQSTALLAGFLWMTQSLLSQGKSVIWLLEEPEPYLHPELSQAVLSLLERLRVHSLVIATTHSLAFVPQNPSAVCGTEIEARRTVVTTYRTYTDATQRLRSALGVRFSDYYNLGLFNVLVEGQSDREMLEWFLGLVPADRHPWPRVRAAAILDFGGVKYLAGFIRATYSLIRLERPCVAMFDGDEAGQHERNDLQRYFGRIGVPFQPNRNFVSVRNGFAIEGLFPDAWVIELYAAHTGWFEAFSQDVSGDLESFRVKSRNKEDLQRALARRAEGETNLSWATRWTDLCVALERALEALERDVAKVSAQAESSEASGPAGYQQPTARAASASRDVPAGASSSEDVEADPGTWPSPTLQ
ncbi:ATP-dependent nuclease [Cellulomonas olei]|uniref:ATP-dependent nuclease n=1 Tax=Cellulomonas sp. P4 TaxID=3142533 RepID=UPI0031BB7463